MALSYSQGLGTTPLLGETIGENFDRAVREHPDRDALVVRHQDVRLTYAELGEAVDRAARALAGLGLVKGDRVGIWAPNCAEWVVTQFATAKLGVILVNINPAYRTTRARLRAAAVRLPGAGLGAGVQDLGLPGDDRARSAATCPTLEHVLFIGEGAVRATRRTRSSGPSSTSSSRSTSSTRAAPRASPKGATLSHSNILNNGYFVGEFCDYTEAGPRLHPGALLPLLRHGHGQPRLRLPRRLHGHPGAVVRARRDARGGGRGALHEPLRRADDVHRRARGPELRRPRPDARCGPGSWPARRAPSRSCARSSTACTWRA